MIVGHVMGLPIEESVLQLAPAAAAILAATTIAGRSALGKLRRSVGHAVARRTSSARGSMGENEPS